MTDSKGQGGTDETYSTFLTFQDRNPPSAFKSLTSTSCWKRKLKGQQQQNIPETINRAVKLDAKQIYSNKKLIKKKTEHEFRPEEPFIYERFLCVIGALHHTYAESC